MGVGGIELVSEFVVSERMPSNEGTGDLAEEILLHREVDLLNSEAPLGNRE